jgi:colanic acid/amylovoran biosynthesis glycosyltransferase
VTPDPELTIVLVARDAASWIGVTIASILEHHAVTFELLVVDDASRDRTTAVVGSFSDPRLRLIRLPAPRGNPHGWNRALQESRSPYVMIVSEGDRLLGSAPAEMVAALERDPAAALAHACWFGVDAEGRIRLQAFREHRQRVRYRLPEDLDHRRALVADGNVIQALPTWRRDLVAALGGFDESLGRDADYALALRCLDRAEIRLVPRFLCARPDAARPKRSWTRAVGISRSLVRTGSLRFPAREPYRLGPLVVVGLVRRIGGQRLRQWTVQTYWRLRRLARRVSPLRMLRDELGSGRLYQQLVDRMSWWPLGRVPRAEPRGAPVRIAYVLWRYPLLSETFIRREIHALRRAGVAVDVIADEPGEGDAENHPAAPAGAVVYLHPIPATRVRQLARGFLRSHPLRLLNLFFYGVFHRYTQDKTLFRDVRQLRKAVYLAGVLRDRGATHVHCPWADQHAFLALLASRLLGLPYSVQARAHEIHRRTANFALAEKIRNARFVVTNSAFNAAHLRPLLGSREASSLHTIYNGIDLAEFRPAVRDRAPNLPRLLSVGRLVEQKGFEDLLQACAILRDRGLAFQCDIVGGAQVPEDSNTVVRLGRLHKSLELAGLVRFVGELPFSGILDAFQAADIFVLPCVVAADGGSDVTPNAVIEAMAMRLPVVSTSIAAIPEIVDDGINGVLVPPRDPVALADALSSLLLDADLRTRLATAARKKIEARFDLARNIRSYVALFEQGTTP